MSDESQNGKAATTAKPRRGKKPTVEVLRETSALPAPRDIDPDLRRIVERNAQILALRAEYEERHQEMTRARKALEDARLAQEQDIAGLAAPMPLFDHD